jgi:hypothetical protein
VTVATSYSENDARHLQTVLTLEYGLSDRWQIEASLPYHDVSQRSLADESGLGDLELGLLWNTHRDRRSYLSAALEVSLPTGDEDAGLSEGEIAFEPSVLYSRLSEELGVFLNAGGEFSDGEAGASYGAGIAKAVHAWTFTSEIAGEHADSEDELVFAAGALWRGWPGLDLGIAVPIGLSEDAEDWGVILSLTWEPRDSDRME